MSLHVDTSHSRLVFEPYQPPVVKMGAWPVKRKKLSEILRQHFPLIRKIVGTSLVYAYFLTIGVQFALGADSVVPKFSQKTDLERAIEWVKS